MKKCMQLALPVITSDTALRGVAAAECCLSTEFTASVLSRGVISSFIGSRSGPKFSGSRFSGGREG